MTVDRQCGSSQQAVHLAAAGVMPGTTTSPSPAASSRCRRVPMLCTITQGPGLPFGPRMSARYDGGLVPQGVAPRSSPSAGACPARSRRVRRTLARPRRRGHRQRRGRRPAGPGRRRWSRPTRASAAARPRDAGRAEDRVPGGRRGDGRQLVADLRRRRGAARHDLRGGGPPRLAPAGPGARGRPRRRRPGHHAHRADPGDRAGRWSGPGSAWTRSTRSRSTRRSRRSSLAWLAETGADPERVNPRGGAIALGHPLGGSGARLMTTLRAPPARHRGRYGLQTMCEGGGMANATVLERL